MADLGDWRDDAACREADHPDRWWDGHPDAYRTCRDCPVRTTCLDVALAGEQADRGGIWGGTSHNSRARIRRGTLTAAEAMRLGDQHADMRTPAEQLADDEPWLLEVPA